jgi:hypothetical protein
MVSADGANFSKEADSMRNLLLQLHGATLRVGQTMTASVRRLCSNDDDAARNGVDLLG